MPQKRSIRKDFTVKDLESINKPLHGREVSSEIVEIDFTNLGSETLTQGTSVYLFGITDPNNHTLRVQ